MTLNSNLLPPVTVSLPFLVQHVAAKSMIKEPGSSAWTTGPHASALMLPRAQDRLCTKAQQAAYLSADMYQAGHPCSLCSLDHISGAGHSSFKKCLPWSAAEAEGQALNGWSSLHPFRSAHRRLCRA